MLGRDPRYLPDVRRKPPAAYGFACLLAGAVAGCQAFLSFDAERDAASAGGPSDAGAPDTSPIAPEGARYVFVTSGTHDGDLAAIAGAHAGFCEQYAQAGRPELRGRKFVALIGIPGKTTTQRIPDAPEGFRTPDGQLVTSSARLVGTLEFPLRRDQNGMLIEAGAKAWTGLDEAAIPTAKTCAIWTDPFTFLGGVGAVGGEGSTWIRVSDELCSGRHHLYCVEVPP